MKHPIRNGRDAVSTDPVAEPDLDSAFISDMHEEDDPLHPTVIPGLTEHETEDFTNSSISWMTNMKYQYKP